MSCSSDCSWKPSERAFARASPTRASVRPPAKSGTFTQGAVAPRVAQRRRAARPAVVRGAGHVGQMLLPARPRGLLGGAHLGADRRELRAVLERDRERAAPRRSRPAWFRDCPPARSRAAPSSPIAWRSVCSATSTRVARRQQIELRVRDQHLGARHVELRREAHVVAPARQVELAAGSSARSRRRRPAGGAPPAGRSRPASRRG